MENNNKKIFKWYVLHEDYHVSNDKIVDAIKKAFDNLQRITMTYNETAYTYVHIFDLYAFFFSLTSI